MSVNTNNNLSDAADEDSATVRLDSPADTNATTRIDAQNTAAVTQGATTRLDAGSTTSASAQDATVRLGTTMAQATTSSVDATTRIDAAAPSGTTQDATVRLDAGTLPSGSNIAAGDATVRLGHGAGSTPGTGPVHSSAQDDATVRLGGGISAVKPGSSKAAMVGDTATDSVGVSLAGAGPTVANLVLQSGHKLTLKGVPYTVKKIISNKGGEANTYRLVDDAGNDYALKQYKNNATPPLDVLKNIKAYPHPNVVELKDYGSEHGFDYELQAYAKVGNLEKVLKEEGAIKDPKRLRQLVYGILEGLKHLHTKVDIIYQDLKPSNILFNGKTFKNIWLSDFGISTRRNHVAEAENIAVTASVTAEYAAPELARLANNQKVRVTNKVDYYALGITLWECWCPDKPFKNLASDGSLRHLIDEGKLELPPDMDVELAQLITGLLSTKASDRFNYVQIERWLNGQPLTAPVSHIKYKKRQFIGNEFFENKVELAALMEKHPAKGYDHFYAKMIEQWLEEAGDMDVHTSLIKIKDGVGPSPSVRMAGVKQFIYTLDPARPIFGPNGKAYSFEHLGFLLLENYDYYLDELVSDPNNDFYPFLRAHDNEQYAEEVLVSFNSQGVDKKRTMNSLINALIGYSYEGKFFLNGKLLESPDQLNAIDQGLMINELSTDHSRTLLWLHDVGLISDSISLKNLPAYDLIALCDKISSLNPEKIQPNIKNKAADILEGIAKNKTHDLLRFYEGLGLDFKFDQALFCAFNQGDYALGSYMLEQGANPNAVSSQGVSLIQAASYYRLPNWINLVTNAGGDVQKTTDKFTSSPLDIALYVDNTLKLDVSIEVVTALLDAGADPNARSDNNVLPLHTALYLCNPEVMVEAVDLMIERGADIHLEGRSYIDKDQKCNAFFAAIYAIKSKHQSNALAYQQALQAVDLLINAGADVNQIHLDRAALHYAAENNLESLVDFLLEKKARMDVVNKDLMLPVTYAALKKNESIEKKLTGGLSKKSSFKLHWMRFLGFFSVLPFVAFTQKFSITYEPARGVWVFIACVLFGFFISGDSKSFRKIFAKGEKKKNVFILAFIAATYFGLIFFVFSKKFDVIMESYPLTVLINFLIIALIALRFILNPGLQISAYRRYQSVKDNVSPWWFDFLAAAGVFAVLFNLWM